MTTPKTRPDRASARPDGASAPPDGASAPPDRASARPDPDRSGARREPAPALDRRTASAAVLTVVLALGGLATWVSLAEGPRSAPLRTAPMPSAEPPADPAPRAEGPPGADPAGGAGPATAEGDARGPLAGVAWGRVDHPVDCGRLGVDVTDVVLGDVTGDGTAEAAVTVRCAAGAGSPPSALFVYAAEPGSGEPTPLATLVRPEQDLLLTSVSVEAGRVIATGTGYSRPDLPRCCPDRTVRAAWRWDGSALRPAEQPE